MISRASVLRKPAKPAAAKSAAKAVKSTAKSAAKSAKKVATKTPAKTPVKTATRAAPKTGVLPEWNLADLYSGIDAPEIAHDLQKMDADCVAFETDYRGKLAEHTAREDGGDWLAE